VLNKISHLVQLAVALRSGGCDLEVPQETVQPHRDAIGLLNAYAAVLHTETNCELAYPVDCEYSEMTPKLRFVLGSAPSI
jgi:hypothetical protein